MWVHVVWSMGKRVAVGRWGVAVFLYFFSICSMTFWCQRAQGKPALYGISNSCFMLTSMQSKVHCVCKCYIFWKRLLLDTLSSTEVIFTPLWVKWWINTSYRGTQRIQQCTKACTYLLYKMIRIGSQNIFSPAPNVILPYNNLDLAFPFLTHWM